MFWAVRSALARALVALSRNRGLGWLELGCGRCCQSGNFSSHEVTWARTAAPSHLHSAGTYQAPGTCPTCRPFPPVL